MKTFITNYNRDAWQVTRGYLFQVYITVLRWLNLDEDQKLELERGEDIDIVNLSHYKNEFIEDRLLEQVKYREKSITLRSSEAKFTILNAIENMDLNPEHNLVFRYITNAQPGKERFERVPKESKGIDDWEGIRSKRFVDDDFENALKRIQIILNSIEKPTIIKAKKWERFNAIINDKNSLIDLISKFEWCTSFTEILELRDNIEKIMVDKNYSSTELETKEKFIRLIFRIYSLLSTKGIKVLTKEDLITELTLPTLSEEDHKKLEELNLHVLGITERLDQAELEFQKQDQINQNFRKRFNSLEQNISEKMVYVNKQFADADTSVEYSVETPIISVPPQVENYCSREENIAELKGILSDYNWLNIFGGIGSGKTQLAILLTQAYSNCQFWLRMRGLTSIKAVMLIDNAIKSLIGRNPINDKDFEDFCRIIGINSIVVFDDLPAVFEDNDLSYRLLQFVNTCKNYEIKIISTSPSPLSEWLLERLEENTLNQLPVPAFSDKDVIELLIKENIASTLDVKNVARMLNVIAQGHSMLIVGMTHFLKQQEWKFDNRTFERLLKGDYAPKIIENIARRLVESVDDKDIRELLYRSTLVVCDFTIEDINLLAQAEPTIPQPQEKLLQLLGLWIERDVDGRLRLSPLIKKLGSSNLSPTTVINCNNLLANNILKKGKLNPYDVVHTILYLIGAESTSRAGWLYLMAISQLYISGYQKDHAGLLDFWSTKDLPVEMDLQTRILIRGSQAKLYHRFNRDPSFVLDDLDKLMLQITEDIGWVTWGIAMDIVPTYAKQDPMRCNHLIRQMIKHGREVTLPSGEKFEMLDEISFEILIWITAFGIETIEHQKDWIETFKIFDKDSRDCLINDEFFDMGCRLVTESAWLFELKKPVEEQNWMPHVEVLEDIAFWAKENNIELLWACAKRIETLILTEHLKDYERAIKNITLALSEANDDPDVQFLLKEGIGRHYGYQGLNNESIEWLDTAFREKAIKFPIVRSQAYIYSSKTISKSDPTQSVQYLKKAVAIGRNTDIFPPIERIKALGELVIALWLNDEIVEAYQYWNEAAEILFANKEKSDSWKSLFQVFGHVSGYLSSIACDKEPPQKLQDGSPYKSPERGFFIYYREDLSKEYGKYPDSILMVQMGQFADGIHNYTEGQKWVKRAYNEALTHNHSSTKIIAGPRIVFGNILNHEYEQALDMGIEISKTTMAMQKFGSHDLSLTLTASDEKKILDGFSDEVWIEVENFSHLITVLPISFHIATQVIRKNSVKDIPINKIANRLKEISKKSLIKAKWLKISELYDQMFSRDNDFNKYYTDSKLYQDGSNYVLNVLHLLAASIQHNADPKNAIISQLSFASSLFKLSIHDSFLINHIFTPFFLAFWKDKFANTRFMFQTPSLVSAELEKVNSLPVDKQAKKMLLTIVNNLDVPPVPTNIMQWLNE